MDSELKLAENYLKRYCIKKNRKYSCLFCGDIGVFYDSPLLIKHKENCLVLKAKKIKENYEEH